MAPYVTAVLVLFIFFSVHSSASDERNKMNACQDKTAARYEETWGICPIGIRLSAGGYMLDFRYRVLDKEKAAPLFSRESTPYLIIKSSGQRFSVAETQRFGALRQTKKPEDDKNYYIIFINSGRHVKKGDAVTVIIGDIEIEDLVVS